MKNEYLEKFNAVTGGYYTHRGYEHRPALVKKYAWAVPNDAVIARIAKMQVPVVELGAGTGYWAGLLRGAGVEVHAYDKDPHTNHWCSGNWSPVLPGDHTAARWHHDAALMLVWPPYADPFANDALHAYHGKHLIYVGEYAGGCTGDDRFHDRLRTQWRELQCTDIPRWYGIHDYAWFYERK